MNYINNITAIRDLVHLMTPLHSVLTGTILNYKNKIILQYSVFFRNTCNVVGFFVFGMGGWECRMIAHHFIEKNVFKYLLTFCCVNVGLCGSVTNFV